MPSFIVYEEDGVADDDLHTYSFNRFFVWRFISYSSDRFILVHYILYTTFYSRFSFFLHSLVSIAFSFVSKSNILTSFCCFHFVFFRRIRCESVRFLSIFSLASSFHWIFCVVLSDSMLLMATAYRQCHGDVAMDTFVDSTHT